MKAWLGKDARKKEVESLIKTVDKDRSPDEAVVETRTMDNNIDLVTIESY